MGSGLVMLSLVACLTAAAMWARGHRLGDSVILFGTPSTLTFDASPEGLWPPNVGLLESNAGQVPLLVLLASLPTLRWRRANEDDQGDERRHRAVRRSRNRPKGRLRHFLRFGSDGHLPSRTAAAAGGPSPAARSCPTSRASAPAAGAINVLALLQPFRGWSVTLSISGALSPQGLVATVRPRTSRRAAS
jgi:hypothetical protein